MVKRRHTQAARKKSTQVEEKARVGHNRQERCAGRAEKAQAKETQTTNPKW